MRTAFYQWLVEAEDALLRMIRGVFRFVIEGLPIWIYRFAVDTAGPVTIRSCRVLVLAYVWLMILISPYWLACVCGLHGWWKFASAAWVVVAIIGSLWGLERAIKKRKSVGVPPRLDRIGEQWIAEIADGR